MMDEDIRKAEEMIKKEIYPIYKMVIGSKYPVTEYYAKSRYRAKVDPAKCIGCRTCVDKRCQFGASQMRFYPEYGQERAYIDEEKCMGCGLCVINCPSEARTMKMVRPPDHIPAPDAVAGEAD